MEGWGLSPAASQSGQGVTALSPQPPHLPMYFVPRPCDTFHPLTQFPHLRSRLFQGEEVAVTGGSPWSSVRDQGTPCAWGFGMTLMVPGDKADPRATPSCHTEHLGAPEASPPAWDPWVLCLRVGFGPCHGGSRAAPLRLRPPNSSHQWCPGKRQRFRAVALFYRAKTRGPHAAAPLCPSVRPSVYRW